MKDEVTHGRPSVLSGIFRKHVRTPADGGTGILRDWTRQVDGDFRLYCGRCYDIVIFIEEKSASALQNDWSNTRRCALHHLDQPWAWRVTTRGADNFELIRARLSDREGHQTFGPYEVGEAGLLEEIVVAFATHWRERNHPAQAIPMPARAILARR